MPVRKIPLRRHSYSDWIFPNLSKEDRLNKHISVATVSKRFKDLASMLDLDPNRFGSHSGRKTGATALVQAGVSVPQLKNHGRWKSDVVYKYYVPGMKEKLAVTLDLFDDAGENLESFNL